MPRNKTLCSNLVLRWATRVSAPAVPAGLQKVGNTALDSIEWIGDASMIPDITPLLQHPNAEVREAAENSIYYLEE